MGALRAAHSAKYTRGCCRQRCKWPFRPCFRAISPLRYMPGNLISASCLQFLGAQCRWLCQANFTHAARHSAINICLCRILYEPAIFNYFDDGACRQGRLPLPCFMRLRFHIYLFLRCFATIVVITRAPASRCALPPARHAAE